MLANGSGSMGPSQHTKLQARMSGGVANNQRSRPNSGTSDGYMYCTVPAMVTIQVLGTGIKFSARSSRGFQGVLESKSSSVAEQKWLGVSHRIWAFLVRWFSGSCGLVSRG